MCLPGASFACPQLYFALFAYYCFLLKKEKKKKIYARVPMNLILHVKKVSKLKVTGLSIFCLRTNLQFIGKY